VDPLTDFVIDTVALVRYLEDELPAAADRAFRDAEAHRCRLFLPEIALAEFIYVALRGRIRAPNARALIDEVVDQIRASEYLALSFLPPAAWDTFLHLNVAELHDRMVISDAIYRGLALITNDPVAASVEGLRTLWR
jgi:predicted nucleic acid-binding protein